MSERIRVTWPNHLAGTLGRVINRPTAETANIEFEDGSTLPMHKDNFTRVFTGYTVKLIRTTFLDSEVWEGDYLNAPSTETDIREYEDMHALDMVRLCREYGLSFEATGHADWASNPDGSQIVDYREGKREEVTFHFGEDVPERLQLAVMAKVG